ncbi:MAG: hypothetical protein DRO23_04525 [Thermoprotei archaeon]|nr:MAG: hypothetical protein DRO23_04525 [Thermoprotei archaeon]
MKATYALKILVTIALLTILILVIITRYLGETFFLIDITYDINTFHLEVETKTWAFVLTYTVLLVLYIYLKRRFKR